MNMKSMIKAIVGVAWLHLLIACSTLEVGSSGNPEADITGLTTYTWRDEPVKIEFSQQAPENIPQLQNWTQEAIDRELASKGYKKVEKESADLLVAAIILLDDVRNYKMVNSYYGYEQRTPVQLLPYGGGVSNPPAYEFRQGSLVLDIAAAKDNVLLWRGYARDEVLLSASQSAKLKKLTEAIKKVLAQFPSRS